MSKNAEVFYTIENDRPSITIRYSAQEEGDSKPDLCDMLSQIQEAITKFQAKPQPKLLSNTEVVVQDVPQMVSSEQTTQTKSFSGNKGKASQQKYASTQDGTIDTSLPGTISKKQIGKIRVNLKFRNIPEKDFCTSHGIARIEDLPGKYAWDIINQEDY